MIGKIIIKIVGSLLKNSRLSQANHNLLITFILDKLVALPIRDIITYNEEGNLLVDGRTLELEHMRILRESALAALNNQALKLVHDRANFAAVTSGMHQASTDQQIGFGKAAIWYGQKEIEFLRLLAGDQNGNSTPSGD